MTLEIHSSMSFPNRLSQREDNHYFWICSSSTLLCQEVSVGQLWVNFTSLIWNQLRLCCDHFWLYYILRTGSLFEWMIELITVVKCHFLDLGHLSPQVLNIYMREIKYILPLARAYFLWEDVAFSKTFQHET